MNYRLCITLCLAIALGLASASRNFDTGRQLLQSPNSTDCSRSIKNCVSCRYQFYRGTVTKAICLQCDVGYVAKGGGRACWCAPGYTQNLVADPTGDTCAACGENNYCVGAKATKASGAAKVACGANKRTNGAYARSARECLAQPGYGWALGDAIDCEVGFYNPGDNNRKCTRCPGGLTTSTTKTVSTQGCIAPAGYYYLRGRAVACARGTWKSAKGNDDCTLCPEGFTTPKDVVANLAANGADCKVLMPGFEAVASQTVGTGAVATMCPEGTYRVVELDYVTGTGHTCDPCPDGMSTLPNVTAATSPDACLVLPGRGWKGGASPGATEICHLGEYNPGWNREACTSCGLGITTNVVNSTSPDDCKILEGYGTNRTATGVLMAFECPKNTYGRPNATYGLVDVECTKCPEHTHTNKTASTSNLDCLTDPGYGWYEGQVLQCEYATYNPGENHNPCTLCAEGYNTSAPGKTANTDCQVAAGWTAAGAVGEGVKPCLRGWYKDTLGTANCTECPDGTTTTITLAATARSDCDACRPGFGQAVIAYAVKPACTMCTSGLYSPGYVKNGASCSSCPKPTGYTGLMVSRKGVSTSEDCVPEFPTDAVTTPVLENKQDWDVIWMNESLTVQATKTSITLCQDGCSATFPNDLCQYFEWREWMASGAQCYYKLAAGAIADPGNIDTITDASYILFEVKPGQYVAYLPGDSENVDFVGETLNTTFTTRVAAVDACDKDAACIGITHKVGIAIWRLFKGTKWEGAVGKVKVVGEAINPWIAEPSSTPNI